MMGEIRDSEKRQLLERVRRRAYERYLLSMGFPKLRGFQDAEIRFDFPVTALVGPNGAGKTTVLGAAGLIYEEVKPRRFFAKAGRYDESMKDWQIEYELIDRTRSSSGTGLISRTASYKRAKWNRNAVSRPVAIAGISRTLPATERTEFYKFVGGEFRGVGESTFTEQVTLSVQRILGKDAANYLRVNADRNGKYSIFAVRGTSVAPGNYSEFHFGAGEASIIRIISEIEAVGDYSLILIEEIENGLHPVATRRLVEYLVDVARRKSCQVIFTTHSDAALEPLPDEAVWSAYRGQLAQGKLDIQALRTLTGEINAALAIFTEDKFAELVAEVSLRAYSRLIARHVDLASIKIHAVGGAVPARDQTRFHNSNPTKTFDAIAFLDGDKRSEGGYEASRDNLRPKAAHVAFADTIYGPGSNAPEDAIIDDIMANLDSLGSIVPKLTLALQFDTDQQARVREVIEQRYHTNFDRHLIMAQIGEDLNFLSEQVVARAFVSTWANFFPEKVREIWDPVADMLPYSELSERERWS